MLNDTLQKTGKSSPQNIRYRPGIGTSGIAQQKYPMLKNEEPTHTLPVKTESLFREKFNMINQLQQS